MRKLVFGTLTALVAAHAPSAQNPCIPDPGQPCGGRGALYGSQYPEGPICFPDAASSFADVVIRWDYAGYPGNCAGAPQYPNYADPSRALGFPDFQPAVGGGGSAGAKCGGVRLGTGGCPATPNPGAILLGFTDNELTNSGDAGADLVVFEAGNQAEDVAVALRPADATTADILRAWGLAADADGFFPIGNAFGYDPQWNPSGPPNPRFAQDIDLDSRIPGQAGGALRFDAVKLTADPIQNNPSGPEIDAVGAVRLSPAAPPVGWVERFPSAAPSARQQLTMIYDAARGYTMQFGGWTGGAYGYRTWIWDGWTWRVATSATSPRSRATTAMAFDAQRARVVLFGGNAGPNNDLADTWEWDGTDWLQRVPATTPPRRGAHAMEFDSRRGRTVLFGGQLYPSGQLYGDTWEWDGVTWTPVTTARSPAPQAYPSMAFDERRGVIVLSGPDGTWEFDGRDWTQRGAAGAPRGELVWDAERGLVVMVAFDSYHGSTWEWHGESWEPIFSALHPGGRSTGLAYDRARLRTVLFGGAGVTSGLGDTWELLAPGQSTFGRGCAGARGEPRLEPLEAPRVGQPYALQLRNLPLGLPGVIFPLGVSSTVMQGGVRLPLRLDPLGFPGCTLYVDPEFEAPVPPSPIGVGQWGMAIPPSPALVGTRLYGQAAFVDFAAPGGMVFTNGCVSVIRA